ncbi:bifunctional phosphopantothenoylcysteine decarboxylase/phosphopantothenate--cysteine ligase CoaBC [Desulforamulus aeronauticus]|uniref:bifunctional phosphopantothenoylcysteine decarboxylase/phosphopantothenate--cysteine ligase CoaBC n=1 Tax=Desulforamulus aeronauticus TaxID=53343 RepID=UPI000934EF48|nr:bifunctional phosphopantothenoylcysteine decarboxylase/phosphopantothenate--cysteine ligase CoaBC [Desulforamulus aeronauticus]
MLAGKRITVGVTGGIAAFKAAELVSTLVKLGAEVHVAMTSSALEFITPLTFEVLTANRVETNLFEKSPEGAVLHIDLAQKADLLVIVPATANIIGKAANGIADDMVSTLILAARCPVLFCPAMNVVMYHNPVVQSNMKRLKELGYPFVEPGEGRLACGTSGKGRLADLDSIIYTMQKLVTPQDLAGLDVLVTAGPTREPLDPVRYLSNRSSGKMGYALAKAAALRGARVTLISGPTALVSPPGVEIIQVQTAEQMFQEVIKRAEKTQIIIKAAAVADYRPLDAKEQKIKKQGQEMNIEFTQNRDILAELGRQKGAHQLLVGFAAETNDLVQNAIGKLKRKNVDLLVANDVTQPGAGFDYDTNIVRIFDQNGELTSLPRLDKQQVAWEILNIVVKMFNPLRGN